MRTILGVITLAVLCLALGTVPAAAAEQQNDQAGDTTTVLSLVEPITDSAGLPGGAVWLSNGDAGCGSTYSCSRDLNTGSPCYQGGGIWGTWWVHQNCQCTTCSVTGCVTVYYYCVS